MAKKNLIDSAPLYLTYTLEPNENQLIVSLLEARENSPRRPFTFNYWSEAAVERVFYNPKNYKIRFIFDETNLPKGGEVLSIVGWFYVPVPIVSGSDSTSNSVE
jgi:hypothetical protein